MKYRTKLVVVDAEQFQIPYDAKSFAEQKAYCDRLGVSIEGDIDGVENKKRDICMIRFTTHTSVSPKITIANTDWIITDDKGERSICRDVAFKDDYEEFKLTFAAFKEGLKRSNYVLRQCSMCRADLYWTLQGDNVWYQSGCDCTASGDGGHYVDEAEFAFYLDPEHGHTEQLMEFCFNNTKENT